MVGAVRSAVAVHAASRRCLSHVSSSRTMKILCVLIMLCGALYAADTTNSASTVATNGTASSSVQSATSKRWEPKGIFDPIEIIRGSATNHVLVFETNRVTHFMPDGSWAWMGVYEKTNDLWVWHMFANNWKLEPDGDSLLCTELGDTNNPLLRNPTHKFHLTPRASMPDYSRKHE